MLAFCQGKNILNSQFDKYALNGSYVLRDADPSSSYDDDFFNAGICPAGQQDTIYEPYQNLALRTVEGTDIAIYYDFETSIGDFSVTLQSSITDKFEQEPSAQFSAIAAAVADGTLPPYISLEGYGDLKNNENIGTDQKDTLKVNYRRGDWGASLSALRVGELFDNGVKSDDGQVYVIPSMTTANVSVYKKLTLKKLQEALVKTLEITALIMVLVAASNFFGAVFARLGTPMVLTDFLLSLEMNRYLILAIVMVVIFLLGWPLEWVPIVMIIVPIILPLIQALEFNLTWFAILVAVNLQTAWLSPPVALSAYFLKGVVPSWDLKDIYLGMMQFMVLQVIGLIIIIIFPKIVLWLPTVLYGQ